VPAALLSQKQAQAPSTATEAEPYEGHGKQAGKQQKQAGYTQQQQDVMSPQPREMLRSELSVSEASAAAATAAAGEGSAAARSGGSTASRRSRRGSRLKLPLPLVLAGGALLGAAGYMLNVKPRYVEVGALVGAECMHGLARSCIAVKLGYVEVVAGQWTLQAHAAQCPWPAASTGCLTGGYGQPCSVP
jgi:hypothetical protein